MNVLITGADGFVGSHLAELLLTDSNSKLSGMIREGRPSSNIQHLKSKIQLFGCDITNAVEVSRVIESVKPEKIFHLAGQAFVPHSVRNPFETFKVNIDGGVNLLEATRKQNGSCSVLIVSSGEVYGSVSPDRLPIDESTPLNPGNPYAASKACIDLIAQQYRMNFGMNVIVARPFNHLGPRQSELFVGSAFAKQIAEIKLGKREPDIHVGNLEPNRDFTDVRDVVKAYIQLLEQPQEYGVFNISSGTSIRIKELLDMMCKISGVKVEIIPDPERQRSNDISEITGSSIRLQRATGWKPRIALEQTVRDLIEYWEKELRR